jgi:hypothetical protein
VHQVGVIVRTFRDAQSTKHKKPHLSILADALGLLDPDNEGTVVLRTVLCCTVLYCTVLCCAVLYCTVLCCVVLYCTVLYCTVLYCAVLYCTVLYCTVLTW